VVCERSGRLLRGVGRGQGGIGLYVVDAFAGAGYEVGFRVRHKY
jgi:hypothetical protein